MATLGGIQIFVKDENITRAVDSTSHPVEQGNDITDHIKLQPVQIRLTGEIVGNGAASSLSILAEYMKSGKILDYSGRNIYPNMQIATFDTGHPNTIKGGCSFTMTLKEVRIANSAVANNSFLSAMTSAGTQQVQKNTSKGTPVYHTVKKGDSRWSMAQAYGTTIDSITKSNNIKNISTNGSWATLKVGSKVLVGYK